MPRSAARRISARTSARCCTGVRRSCSSQWRREPLASRFTTRQPARQSHSTEIPPSMKPSASIRSRWPRLRAHSVMARTAASSPGETRAEAISIRLTRSSSSSRRAMESFSRALNDTPEVCSPSRSVVSKISTPAGIGVVIGPRVFFRTTRSAEECSAGSPHRRSRSAGTASCRRRSRTACSRRSPRS